MNIFRHARRPVANPSRRRSMALAASCLAAGWLTAGHATAQTIVYNNLPPSSTSFGFVANGNATSATGNTALLADDIAFAAGAAGQGVTSFTIAIGNGGGTAQSATATVEFFAANGTNNGPGTLLASYSLPQTSYAGGITNQTLSLPRLFTIPANGLIWAGVYFTGSAGGTLAGLNNLGVQDLTPPSVGSSNASTLFLGSGQATTAGSPAGSIAANPNAGQPGNLGMQFAVPEPSSVAGAVLGGGVLLGWVLRRRRA